MGLFGFAFGSAAFLAPLVGPPLYQAAGATAVWVMTRWTAASEMTRSMGG